MFIRNQDDAAFSQPPKDVTSYLADTIYQTFSKMNIAKPRASAVAYKYLPQRIFQSRKRGIFCKNNLTLDIQEPIGVLQELSNSMNMSSFSSIFEGFNFSKFSDDMYQYIDIFTLCTSDYREYIKNKQTFSKSMLEFAESRVKFGTFNFEKEAQVTVSLKFTCTKMTKQVVSNISA